MTGQVREIPIGIPAPRYDHLRELTDAGGLYEHAKGPVPRHAHGYCVDDVARALVVVCRDHAAGELDDLRVQYLTFVLAAQEADGRFHNRRRRDLTWSDTASVEDCWGRALWGLGTAVARAPHLRARALAGFDRATELRSPHPRAMAFAALGAAEVLTAVPDHLGARGLIAASVDVVGRPVADPDWPWPAPRLSYANAALPEALLVAGTTLQSPLLVADGLGLLEWLLARQTRDGHLSVVAVGGCGARDTGVAFDQQPIEVAALADACAAAYAIEGRRQWAEGVERAAAWFLGDNDSGTPMHDPVTGGGFDGLNRSGRNENQGAESTLALLSTLQQARRTSAQEKNVP